MATDGANGYDADRHRRRPQRPGRRGVPGQGRPAHGRARAARDARRRGRAPRSSRPASACRPWPTRSAGSGRRSSATSTSSVTGCRSSARTCASSRRASTATAIVLWGDAGPDRRGPAARLGGRRRALRRVRPARPLAGRLPRRARRPDPARHRIARARRCAGRAPARPDVPRARAPRRPDDHPRPADGRRRLRGRIVRDRRAPGGDRLARHPVHRDGPVVGRHDRRAARRLGRQRRRSGRPDGLRAGRAGRAGRRRSSRRRARPASRSGPAPRSSRSPRATAGRPAWCWPTARS